MAKWSFLTFTVASVRTAQVSDMFCSFSHSQYTYSLVLVGSAQLAGITAFLRGIFKVGYTPQKINFHKNKSNYH